MTIPVPTFLIDSPVTSRMIVHGLQRSSCDVSVDPHSLSLFLKELAKVARQYEGLEIVRVESADGELIRVEL